MKKFYEPKMVLLPIEEIITSDFIISNDNETGSGGGGFGPIIRPTKKQLIVEK